jgi:uncharacterized repeat protein (TIGR03803 family)
MRTLVSASPVSGIGVIRLMSALTALAFSAAAQTPSLTTLYSFAGGESGANPGAGVLLYSGGAIIGTTPYGGTTGCGGTGCGTVYELTPAAGGAWSQAVIYTFQGNGDGALPEAAPTLDKLGVLYGTTFAGGATGNGTVFQLAPPSSSGGTWTESVLYSFKGGSDGSGPLGGVFIAASGTLYGTTFGGGTGAGTVFQLTPPISGVGSWTESVVYSFKGGKDGSGPLSGLIGKNGLLIGTTCCGTKGTVFELRESAGTWTKSPVFIFVTRSAGEFPGGLVLGAKSVLYGATSAGGSSDAGIVFSLTPAATKGKLWTLTTIHSFTGGSDGGSPYGSLIVGPNGVLYGTVTTGGAYGAGGVVEFTPPATAGQPWTETVLYSFTGANDGSQPDAGLVLGANNTLFGTTAFGGTADNGTVFELIP